METILKLSLLLVAAQPVLQGPIPPGRIDLGPDDKPAFPTAPQGFDQPKQEIEHGKLETLEYDSKTVGTKRHLMVYTPPGFSPNKSYPTLYLLHGIGGTEREWVDNGAPEAILDNLYAQHKLKPMIVVFPNGRAQKDDRAVGNIYAHAKAFETFEGDLINDVIPFMESHYKLKKGSKNRALAGLSMGGGQSLNFGLTHLETFAWVGGFSSAPNTKTPEVLVPDPDKTKKALKLLWISCGDKDGLFSFSKRIHVYLAEHKVPHIWHVEPGGHTFPVWKSDLYWFSQQIFR